MRPEMIALVRPFIVTIAQELAEIGEDLPRKTAKAVLQELMAQGIALAATAEQLARVTDVPIGCTALEAMRRALSDGMTVEAVAAARRAGS